MLAGNFRLIDVGNGRHQAKEELTICLVDSWTPSVRSLPPFMAELAPCSKVFAVWSPSIAIDG